MKRYLMITALAVLATTTVTAQQSIISPYLQAPWTQADIDRQEPYRQRWAKVWDYIPPPPPACTGRGYCAYHPGVDMNVMDNEGSLLAIEQQIRSGRLNRWYGSN